MTHDLPQRQLLRLLCLLEATTLLALLFVAVPLKHLAGVPAAVSVMGPVHGFAFLLLCWRVSHAAALGSLPVRAAWGLVLAASLPLGGFYSWHRLGR